MRVSRLLALVGLLQSRGSMTATQLASELGVSPRTVYRDVEVLASAGVHLDAEHGPAGGYRMRRGAARSLLALTGADVDAVVRALLSTELDVAAGATAARILAALGPDAAARAGDLRQRFLVAEAEGALTVAARAVSEQRALAVAGDGGYAEVEPLGMVRENGAWVLVAADGSSIRTVRLDADIDISLLDRHFKRPTSFDLEAAWRSLALTV
jgi:predicted DNA-binding transcriptional regulator YafY